MDQKIKYVEHPVTAEHKKELRNQGFKIIDARFAPKGAQIEKSRVKKPESKAKPKAEKPESSGGQESVVIVVVDDGNQFVVELDGVKFSPAKNQVREDGTLTAGGMKAFEAAKLEQSQSE